MPDAPSMAERAFEAAWREFSRRATEVTRVAHRDPGADVRYYAEKHMNSWLLDRAELPPLRLLVLLRDPRDTYASLLAFREATKAELGQRQAADEADYFRRFIERQRDRLRWIAGLEESRDTTIVRYEDLVRDLRGVSGRLEGWLGVELDPSRSCATRRVGWVHRTADSPEKSIGRWRSDVPPDVTDAIAAISRRSCPRSGSARRRAQGTNRGAFGARSPRPPAALDG